eukprot:4611642-Ditylum_brightwellii.AAC.1
MVRNMGFMVDNDNKPVPENMPTAVNDGQNWEWQGLDHRKMQGCQDTDALVKGMNATDFAVRTYLKFFFLFFPCLFIENVILVQTNKNIEGKK